MKKVLFIIGLAVSTVSFGQKKSDKFVSGTISYTKSTDVEGVYSVRPTIGYYVTDKVSVGVFGELGKNATDETTNVGVFERCDFMNIGKNLTVFSQLDLASNTTKSSGVKVNSVSAGLGLGANYSISSKFALTMHVADLISYENSDGSSTTTIGFEGVTNPFAVGKVGLQYRF